MSAPNSTAPVEPLDQAVEHPNAETIRGLREVADFLEAHPELPEAYYASVSLRPDHSKTDARETLTALAEALGDRATETRYSGTVTIRGQFTGVSIHADARVRDLADLPPEPSDYPPIIPSADA